MKPSLVNDEHLNEGILLDSNLADELERLSGQRVEMCYHCHKCTAGCPIVQEMTYGPDQILRMVKIGQSDALMRSRDIWLCVGCYTCTTRCPNDLDIAAIMDGLRQIAIARGYPVMERDTILFHRLFLGVVERLGRSHEGVMLGLFKILSSVPLFNDMRAGIGLFLRGKVPLLPPKTKAAREVRKIFKLAKHGWT